MCNPRSFVNPSSRRLRAKGRAEKVLHASLSEHAWQTRGLAKPSLPCPCTQLQELERLKKALITLHRVFGTFEKRKPAPGQLRMQPTTCVSPGRTLRPTLKRLQRSALAHPPPQRAAIPGRLFRPHPQVGSTDLKHLWCKASRASRGATEYSFPPPAPSDDDTPIDPNYVPKGALLSAKLPADVRKRAEDVIAKRGYSVTVSSLHTGHTLSVDLAADCVATVYASQLPLLLSFPCPSRPADTAFISVQPQQGIVEQL